MNPSGNANKQRTESEIIIAHMALRLERQDNDLLDMRDENTELRKRLIAIANKKIDSNRYLFL